MTSVHGAARTVFLRWSVHPAHRQSDAPEGEAETFLTAIESVTTHQDVRGRTMVDVPERLFDLHGWIDGVYVYSDPDCLIPLRFAPFRPRRAAVTPGSVASFGPPIRLELPEEDR